MTYQLKTDLDSTDLSKTISELETQSIRVSNISFLYPNPTFTLQSDTLDPLLTLLTQLHPTENPDTLRTYIRHF